MRSCRLCLDSCFYEREGAGSLYAEVSAFTFRGLPALPELLYSNVLVFTVQVAVFVGLLLLHVFYYELAKEESGAELPKLFSNTTAETSGGSTDGCACVVLTQRAAESWLCLKVWLWITSPHFFFPPSAFFLLGSLKRERDPWQKHRFHLSVHVCVCSFCFTCLPFTAHN